MTQLYCLVLKQGHRSPSNCVRTTQHVMHAALGVREEKEECV